MTPFHFSEKFFTLGGSLDLLPKPALLDYGTHFALLTRLLLQQDRRQRLRAPLEEPPGFFPGMNHSRD